MEALTRLMLNAITDKFIVLKHSKNKVCKNRIEMPFKELIEYISKKLMPYAMVLTSNDSDDVGFDAHI